MAKANSPKILTRGNRVVKMSRKRGKTAIVLFCRALSPMYQHVLPEIKN